jgi:hypothetical protein
MASRFTPASISKFRLSISISLARLFAFSSRLAESANCFSRAFRSSGK